MRSSTNGESVRYNGTMEGGYVPLSTIVNAILQIWQYECQ